MLKFFFVELSHAFTVLKIHKVSSIDILCTIFIQRNKKNACNTLNLEFSYLIYTQCKIIYVVYSDVNFRRTKVTKGKRGFTRFRICVGDKGKLTMKLKVWYVLTYYCFDDKG